MAPPGDDARWKVAAERARDVLSNEPGAHPRFVGEVFPLLVELCRSSRTLRASQTRDDDAREVATRLVEKLSRDDHAALRGYADWQARHPDQDFADWIRIAAANAMRDLVRQRRGSRPPPGEQAEPSVKQLLNEHALLLKDDELWVRPPFTPVHTARQILDYAVERLPEDQVTALGHWLSEQSFEDIARAQSLASQLDAKRLVRAAVATLRRAFAEDADAPL